MNTPFGRRRGAVLATVPALPVGANISAACGKCKEIKPHIILAMLHVKPTKVECTVCKHAHAYRARMPVRKTAVALDDRSPAEIWAIYMRKAPGGSVPYVGDRRYVPGEKICHATFGEGVVSKILSLSVCEVVFEERTIKLLMMGPTNSLDLAAPTTRAATESKRRRLRA